MLSHVVVAVFAFAWGAVAAALYLRRRPSTIPAFQPRVPSLTINTPSAGAQLTGGLNTVTVSITGLGDQEQVAVDGGGPFALFCQAADVPSGSTVPVISTDITTLQLENGVYTSTTVPAHTGDDRLICWFYLQTPAGKTVRTIAQVVAPGGGN